MDKVDKAKLKCLIKMILIHESPNQLNANQLAYVINKYDWNFRTHVTSRLIGALLKYELKQPRTFLKEIKKEEKKGTFVYYYSVN